MRGGGAGVESGRTQPRPLAGRQHLHRTRSVKHLLRGIPVLATRVAPAVVGVPVLTAAPAAARPTPRRPCRRATRRAVALATASAPHGSAGLACKWRAATREAVRWRRARPCPMPRTVLRSLRLASPKVALDGELDRRAQRCLALSRRLGAASLTAAQEGDGGTELGDRVLGRRLALLGVREVHEAVSVARHHGYEVRDRRWRPVAGGDLHRPYPFREWSIPRGRTIDSISPNSRKCGSRSDSRRQYRSAR